MKNVNKIGGVNKHFSTPLIFLMIFLGVAFVMAIPEVIDDGNPTTGTQTENKTVELNFNITEANLKEINFSWDGFNYSLYDENIVLVYNFNNNSIFGESGSLIYDVSGNGFNSTSITSGATVNLSGRSGGSYSFDGTNERIRTSLTDELNNTNWTISIWVNTYGYCDPSKGSIIGKTWSYWMRLNSDCNIFYNSKNTTGTDRTMASSGNLLNNSNWNHLVYTFNGSWTLGYINGNLEVSRLQNGGVQDDGDNLDLGNLNGEYFNGSIDDLIIWNRSLTTNEISQLYNVSLDRLNWNNYSLNITRHLGVTEVDSGYKNYFVCATDKLDSTNCTPPRSIRLIPSLISINSNFADLIGNIRSDFYGVASQGRWFSEGTLIDADLDGTVETLSDKEWHRQQFLNSGMTNMKLNIGLGEIYTGLSNKGVENWLSSETSVLLNTTSENCNNAVNWKCGSFGANGNYVGNFSRSSDSHSGNYAVNITNNGTGGNISFSYIHLKLDNDSKQYNLSVWMKSTDNGDIKVGANDGAINLCQTTHSGSGNWEKLWCNFSTTSTLWEDVRLEVGRAGAGESVLWDDVEFYEEGTITNYFTYTQGDRYKQNVEVIDWNLENNIKTVNLILSTPHFLANVTENCNLDSSTCNINNFTIWGDILVDFINKTTSDGTVGLENLDFAVWNEPYHTGSWMDGTVNVYDSLVKATEYVILYNNTYDSIKASYPAASVGGPSGFRDAPLMTTTFLSNMTTKMDFVDIHPYASATESGIYLNSNQIQQDISELVTECAVYGANCTRIIATEWNDVKGDFKNETVNRTRYEASLARAYMGVINNYPANTSLTLYQWADQKAYYSNTSYSEYPQLWTMVTERLLRVPGQPTFAASYNITKDFANYHSGGSQVYNSTTNESNILSTTTRKGNDYYITILDKNTEPNEIVLTNLHSDIDNLRDLETGESFAVLGGRLNIGYTTPYEIKYYADNDNPPIITIHSPTIPVLNNTFTLNLTADEDVNTWLVSNDSGITNYTYSPNTSLTWDEGEYDVFVFANDSLGNMGTQSAEIHIDPFDTSSTETSSGSTTTTITSTTTTTDETSTTTGASIVLDTIKILNNNICSDEVIDIYFTSEDADGNFVSLDSAKIMIDGVDQNLTVNLDNQLYYFELSNIPLGDYSISILGVDNQKELLAEKDMTVEECGAVKKYIDDRLGKIEQSFNSNENFYIIGGLIIFVLIIISVLFGLKKE